MGISNRAVSGGAALLIALGTGVIGCSSGDTGTDSSSQLAIVSAFTGVAGAFVIDGSVVMVPTLGHTRLVPLGAGTHQILATSANGAEMASTSVTLVSGSRRTVVLSGDTPGNAIFSVMSDTMSTNPGGGYHANIGSILLVNSAPHSPTYTVVLRQTGSDSVYRLGGFSFGAGSQPPPAPYGYYLPFPPGHFTVDITNPGSDTPLATTQFTLGTDERWVLTLTAEIEGGLILQAVKQE